MNGTERKMFREFDYGRVKIYLIIPSIYLNIQILICLV